MPAAAPTETILDPLDDTIRPVSATGEDTSGRPGGATSSRTSCRRVIGERGGIQPELCGDSVTTGRRA